jgi:diguanylate cyclase (GGDEF)-like protein
MKRTNKELLLLVLSLFAAISISSFAILRFVNSEFWIGFFDSIVGLMMAGIAFHVYTTQRVALASVALSGVNCIGAIATIHIKGVDNVFWVYPAVVSAFYLLSPRRAILLSLFTLLAILPVLVRDLPWITTVSSLTTIFMTCLFGYFFSKGVLEQHQQLSDLATKDSLTGVGNRRALDHKLIEVLANQARRPSDISLLLLDLDHFKKINDEYGHMVGDQILIRIAEIIETRIRITDSLYRFGGEEFVIMPLELNLEQAESFANQLRELVEKQELVTEKKVTISMGAAQYQAGETSESWLKRADEALYRAKNSGRNRVCVAKAEV